MKYFPTYRPNPNWHESLEGQQTIFEVRPYLPVSKAVSFKSGALRSGRNQIGANTGFDV